jgi:hypothetical protein
MWLSRPPGGPAFRLGKRRMIVPEGFAQLESDLVRNRTKNTVAGMSFFYYLQYLADVD